MLGIAVTHSFSAHLFGHIFNGPALSVGDGVKPNVPSVDNIPEVSGLAKESVGKAVARLDVHRFLVQRDESRAHTPLVNGVVADKTLQTVIGFEDSPA